MRDAVADLRGDVQRWTEDLARAEAAGYADLANQIRRWIAEANGIIADSGF
jgi:hypothetical protein